MNLDIEQQALLGRLLGKPTVVFEKAGAYFARVRTPEMDALVDAGALRVEEGALLPDSTVIYIATDKARNMVAITALLAELSKAT
jgi:hypothetical protein